VTVRSSVARGRIRGIRYGDGIPWNEFTIVTAADIPGKNEIALIEHDQPCLAADFINHPRNRSFCSLIPTNICWRMRGAPFKSMSMSCRQFSQLRTRWQNAKSSGQGQRAEVLPYGKRRRGQSMAQADAIIEGEYRTGAQEQLYIGTRAWSRWQIPPTA